MDSHLQSLRFALEKYPEKVEIVAARDLVIDSARQNARRPAFLKLAVPDEVVKAIRGSRKDQDVLLLVRIPGEISDRADSRIVLPGEV